MELTDQQAVEAFLNAWDMARESREKRHHPDAEWYSSLQSQHAVTIRAASGHLRPFAAEGNAAGIIEALRFSRSRLSSDRSERLYETCRAGSQSRPALGRLTADSLYSRNPW